MKLKISLGLMVFCFSISLSIYGQLNYSNTNSVNKAFPFPISEFALQSSDFVLDNEQLSKKKITDYLVKQIEFINKVKYYILIYKDSSKNYFICVDANKNLSFLDDTTYNSTSMTLPQEYTYENLDSLPSFHFFDGSGYYRTIKLCTTNTGITYKTEKENSLYLSAYTYEQKFATIKYAGKFYNLLLFNNSLANYYSTKNTSFFLIPEGKKILPATATNIPSFIGEPVYFNKKIIIIDSILDDGSKFFYRIQENLSGKLIGITSGKYLQYEKYKDVESNQAFLYSVRKDFTLLEFWGTWCAPCMKLTPFIDSIYRKYSNSVHFSGIAFDNNIESVKMFNDKHRRGWTNFYQYELGSSAIVDKLKISAYPTFLLVNRNGKIIFRETGETGIKKITNFLRRNVNIK